MSTGSAQRFIAKGGESNYSMENGLYGLLQLFQNISQSMEVAIECAADTIFEYFWKE